MKELIISYYVDLSKKYANVTPSVLLKNHLFWCSSDRSLCGVSPVGKIVPTGVDGENRLDNTTIDEVVGELERMENL